MNDWETRRTQAVKEAERRFADDPTTARVVEITAAWLTELCARGSTALADPAQLLGPDLKDGIIDRLKEAQLLQWAGRFTLLADWRNLSILPDRILAELAVGAGAGCLCGLDPTAAAFDLANTVQETFGDAHRAFAAGADCPLAQMPGAASALATYLRAQVNDFTAAPRRMAAVFGVNTCALVEAHRQHPRLAEAWGEMPIRGQLELSNLEAYDMLRRHDPRLYLEVIEAFPHPEPTRQLLKAARLAANPAALCALLRMAPLAFDEHGAWIVAAKSPFLLLEFAVGSVRDAALSDGGECGSADEADVVIGQVVDALLSRPDAVHLGYAWAERLVREGCTGGRQAGPDLATGGIVLLIAKILGRLAAALPVLADPLAWVAQGEELRQRERALVVLAVMIQGADPQGDAGEFIATAAQHGLLPAVNIWDALTASNVSLEREIAATAVARLLDPATWFRCAWRLLARARDRARHFVLNQNTSNDGGYVLVVWGLCAAMRLPAASPEVRALWTALETAVRESRLTDWNQNVGQPSWTTAHLYLADLWPRTFPDDPSPGQAGSLDDLVRPFARPNDAFAELVLTLHNHGVSPARIARAALPVPDVVPILAVVAEDLARRRQSSWAPHRGNEASPFEQKLADLIGDLTARNETV